MKNIKKILSFDAETNGLWGTAFSIGAVVMEDGVETARFVARCPISEEVNPWVSENVLPQMEGIEVTHESYEAMLRDFMEFYLQNKEGSTVLVHMGLPVESKLFIDAHNLGIIGDWDAPYPLVDCCACPEIGTSVDSYNEEKGLSVNVEGLAGGTHNPIYDSLAAAVAYSHWLSCR